MKNYAYFSIRVLVTAIGSADAQEVQSSQSCQGQSPTDFVTEARSELHKERWESAVDRVAASPELKSTIDPRGIGFGDTAKLMHYGDDALACWAQQGDQMAAYALSLRLSGISSESHRWLDVAAAGKDALEEAAASVCEANYKVGVMTCDYGLPEAQYIIGGLICAGRRPGSSEDGRAMLERAYLGGLWTARKYAADFCR